MQVSSIWIWTTVRLPILTVLNIADEVQLIWVYLITSFIKQLLRCLNNRERNGGPFQLWYTLWYVQSRLRSNRKRPCWLSIQARYLSASCLMFVNIWNASIHDIGLMLVALGKLLRSRRFIAVCRTRMHIVAYRNPHRSGTASVILARGSVYWYSLRHGTILWFSRSI